MTRFFAALLGLIILIMVGCGVLLFVASDGTPLVERPETVSPTAIAQARRLLHANDPRRLARGDVRQTAIPAALIDEGINYAASRALHGRGALIMGEETAEIRITFAIAGKPSPRYLNLRATIREAEGEPHIAKAAVGSLPIPAFLAESALSFGLGVFGYGQEWQLARGAIRSLAFEPDQRLLVVGYVWEPAILERARAIAFNDADLARLRTAQTALAGLLDHRSGGTPLPLRTVLKPLLDGDNDSREQRRAALFVLATYLAEKKLAAVIPEAAAWPQPKPVALTLQGRYDSAQHFVVSAALAAWAGEPLAKAVGLYKELDDARHGSGFSFADLAADQAGTRFGELVVANSPRLSGLFAREFGDADLAPPLVGLPEFMPDREFRRRFGGPGSPAYQQVMAEIDRRLAAIPLYR